MNELQNTDNENSKKKGLDKKELLDWVKSILAALVVAYVINNFVIVNAVVPTGSMIGTIMPNDRLVANRLSYLVSEPRRGDIIVFKYPDDEKIPYVKRIIGLPGEKVEIKEGKVYINDTALNEPYLNENTDGNFGPYEVPEGRYFMLGDNRDNSRDSRYWDNKYVARNKILGKAWFRYFPRFKVFGGDI